MMNVTSHYRPHYNPPYVRNAMRRKQSKVVVRDTNRSPSVENDTPSIIQTSKEEDSTERVDVEDKSVREDKEEYVSLSSLQNIIDMVNVVYGVTRKDMEYVNASDMTIKKQDYERLLNGSSDGRVDANARVRFMYPMVKEDSSILMRAHIVNKDTGDIQLVWMKVCDESGCLLDGFTS